MGRSMERAAEDELLLLADFLPPLLLGLLSFFL
jgi:hypothetical protein